MQPTLVVLLVLFCVHQRTPESINYQVDQSACGSQLPPPPPPVIEQPQSEVFEGEGQAEWLMAADFAKEYAMLAEISEQEAYEPWTLTEAKHHPDWPLWEAAIHEELETLRKAKTWELTNTPPGANIVGSKWVFRAKKDTADNVI